MDVVRTETHEIRWRGHLGRAELRKIVTLALCERIGAQHAGTTLQLRNGVLEDLEFDLVHDNDWFQKPDPDLDGPA